MNTTSEDFGASTKVMDHGIATVAAYAALGIRETAFVGPLPGLYKLVASSSYLKRLS